MRKVTYAKCIINVLDLCPSGLSLELKVPTSIFWLSAISDSGIDLILISLSLKTKRHDEGLS